MIYLLVFVALVLAAARATRVIVIDEVAAPLRNWVLRKWPVPSKPSKLIRCYWCAGFWISAFLCLLAATAAPAPVTWRQWVAGVCWYLITTFAVAYASSWVLDKEETANGA